MEELKLFAASWDRRRHPATDEDEVESPCARSSPLSAAVANARYAGHPEGRPHHRGGGPASQ
eukprot:1690802-Lingulodinium_polyedra.AAC.1